jgi:hypothetical protein
VTNCLSNVSNVNMDSLMNSIDNIKEKLSDAEYKDLCDQMKELNKQKETDLYRVWYVEVDTTLRTPDTDSEEEDGDAHDDKVTSYYFTRVKSTFVRLSPDEAEIKIDVIKSSGSTLMDSKVLKIEPRTPLIVVQSGKLLKYLESCNIYDIKVVRIDKVDEN